MKTIYKKTCIKYAEENVKIFRNASKNAFSIYAK